MRFRTASFVVLLMFSAATSRLGAEGWFEVTLDQTQLIGIAAPAASVIISNPSIADITVVATNMLAITGKMYGKANLIVRGIDGAILTDVQVQVVPARGVVVLYRGAAKKSLSCTPICQPIFDIGDSEEAAKKNNPCDSPGQKDSAGRRCGGRSAYSRPGGEVGFP